MIPIKGSHPELNVLYLGGYILKKLYERKTKRMAILYLMRTGTKELSISVDHLILALDWLYIISAINFDGKEVFINEVN